MNVTDSNFENEVLKSEKPVLVDFWAEWCKPCKTISPLIDELAAEYEGKVKIVKMDVDSNPLVSRDFGIRSIPTLLFFKDGVAVQQLSGQKTKKEIEVKLKSLV